MTKTPWIDRRHFLLGSGIALAGTAKLPFLDPDVALAADGSLSVGISTNPTGGFGPASQSSHDAMAFMQIIFENLLEVDGDNDIVPCLATGMPEVSADGLTYRFELRDDVFFQNGNKMTAEDVAYSYNCCLDPKYNLSRGSIWRPGVERVVAETPTRVRFDMKRPYANMLRYMSKYMGVFPNGSLENGDAAFQTNPAGLGTGPGIFVDMATNDFVEYKPNPNYWRKGVPAWSKLTFRILPEDATRVAFLMTGECQIIAAPPPKEFVRLKTFPGIAGESRPAPGANVFMLHNNAVPPFDDANFRKALSKAVNRAELAKVFDGMFEPFSLVNAFPGWPINKEAAADFDYDPVAATEYLKKSKYPDGGPEFPVIIPAVPYLINVDEIALVMQAQFAQVGIKMNVRKMEMGQYWGYIVSPGMTSSLQAFMSPPDPTYLPFSNMNDFANLPRTNKEELRRTIEEAWSAHTMAELDPIMQHVQALVAVDGPETYLGGAYVANLWRSDIQGFRPSAGITMRVRDVVPSGA